MDGQRILTRDSKVMGMEDAALLARDALRDRPELCLGGLFKQGRPVALVRALLAAGADGLSTRHGIRGYYCTAINRVSFPPAFLGNDISSTPSLYFALARVSSISCASEKLRLCRP